LLVDRGEALQDRLPPEYKSDVHLRNWLVKCISSTEFKKYLPSARAETSTGVAVEIGRALELHREDHGNRYSSSGNSLGLVGQYPRSKSTTFRDLGYPRSSTDHPSVLWNTEYPGMEQDRPGYALLSLGESDPWRMEDHDISQVEAIFLADPGYKTRMRARDHSAGSTSFRGAVDNRDPPRRPGEKDNDVSTKSGKQLAVLDATHDSTTCSVVLTLPPLIQYILPRC
jgi:hypothetical protein